MSKCELSGCKMPCEKMPPCAKSDARLRRILREWRRCAEPAMVTPPGGPTKLSADAVVTVDEIDAALRGGPMPKRRAS